MNKDLIDILRCPRCFSKELGLNINKEVGTEVVEGKICCAICGSRYPINQGIPIMLPPYFSEEFKKQQQIKSFNYGKNNEEEIERPHCSGTLYKYLMDYKIKKNIYSIKSHIKDKSVLISACGSGMDAEYWANCGWKVIAADISISALLRARERARRRGLRFELVAADGENLPFKPAIASYGFIHDGLHHMEQPHKAIYELWRCSRDYVFINEPSDALITKIAVKIGFSPEYEDDNNFIYRFNPSELKRLFRGFGTKTTRMARYIMWYPHTPNSLFRFFDKPVPFFAFRVVFNIINRLFGRFGNKLWFMAEKKSKK